MKKKTATILDEKLVEIRIKALRGVTKAELDLLLSKLQTYIADQTKK